VILAYSHIRFVKLFKVQPTDDNTANIVSRLGTYSDPIGPSDTQHVCPRPLQQLLSRSTLKIIRYLCSGWHQFTDTRTDVSYRTLHCYHPFALALHSMGPSYSLGRLRDSPNARLLLPGADTNNVATYMVNDIAGIPQALQKSGRPVEAIRARVSSRESDGQTC
jgi:hypothetical protein